MDSMKVINAVPTRLLTFGPGIEDSKFQEIKYIVIVIPGNPGVIEYYRAFMSKIHEELSSKLAGVSVWGISHAGHQVEGTEGSTFPDLSGNPGLYDLEGQIEHKVAFLTQLVPSHAQLVFIGHSIGCKIILEVLKRQTELSSRVLKSYLLFPTLERMRLTPNGRLLWPLSSMRWITTAFIWPLSLLPLAIQRGIVQLYFYNRNAPECVKKATLELFKLDVFQRFISMGFSELEQVFELDLPALVQFKDVLYFYFGMTDGWCPLQFVNEMKSVFPEMSHAICDKAFDHAFVISSSSEMASVISPLIAEVIVPNAN